jgi:hypothetical protein
MKNIFTAISFLFLTIVHSQEIRTVENGKKVILKGQIIDKENNTPVPFATLILKKQEIYRVADENGFYELPISKTMFQNASVEISSMGFEPLTILLKELENETYLIPKFEELTEVVISGFLSPKTVLEKAISKIKINHPIEPFNFLRYAKVIVNNNDTTELDLELITKDCDYGYLSDFVISQRVEQIKWNKNKNPKKYKTSSQFFSYRQNAIRYSNILHKRKFKKFKLSFVKSGNIKDEGLYIISFQTERNKWNYTNRDYPTNYSGKVYIDKNSLAIIKVIENWETTLKQNEIEKILKGRKGFENIIKTTIKEENICYYSDILGNGKYYATKYFNRSYNETLTKENKTQYKIFERDSYLFDFEIKDVEEIEYYAYNNKKENSLKRVDYEKAFWDSFYKREIMKKKE